MAFAPLRFLHAADVRLDQAIGATDRLPPRLSSIIQDATRAAFDRFIALAIEHKVDFVLLAGNTFVEADQSLTARLALLDGFEQLDCAGIRAVVLAGALDPIEAWRRIPELPENVALLDSGPRGTLAIKRDDKVVARVGVDLMMPARKKSRSLRDELRSASQRAVPFKVAAIQSDEGSDDVVLRGWCPNGQTDASLLGPEGSAGPAHPRLDKAQRLPVDYVALGSGASRRTLARRLGIAHNPGPLQGRGPDQPGPQGCTLLSVDQDGTVQCDFLPTASVRWERFNVPVPERLDRDELLARCRTQLERVRPEACENAWIFEWRLGGTLAAVERLDNDAFRRQFREELVNAAGSTNVHDAVHNLIFDVEADWKVASASDDPLQVDLLETLSSGREASADFFRSCVGELRAIDSSWADTLDGLLGDLSSQAINTNAALMGQQLFRAASIPGVAR